VLVTINNYFWIIKSAEYLHLIVINRLLKAIIIKSLLKVIAQFHLLDILINPFYFDHFTSDNVGKMIWPINLYLTEVSNVI